MHRAWLLVLTSALCSAAFRPPAVPLITHDPYFSIWSTTDQLAADSTRHWTGTVQALTSMVRIDGKTYRIMGTERRMNVPALSQIGLEVLPTRTIYQFEGEGVHLALTFFSPVFAQDMELVSRPASYVIWEARSVDSRPHAVSVYFDASAEISVNTPEQPVIWSRFKMGQVQVLRAGSQQQPILQKSGDNLRIDWGYLYLTAPPRPDASLVTVDHRDAVLHFERDGALPDSDDMSTEAPARFRSPVLAYAANMGQVGAEPVSRHIVLAYDDIFGLEYFQRRVRPYWRRNGAGPRELIESALQDYESLLERAAVFDRDLVADLRKVGGEKYAELASLAYRQTLAAHKLVVDADGTPLYFPKENFSNGCIGTVDVFYPSSPFFLLFNPKLLEAQLRPLMDYASMPRWKFPFAPHDLGTYPLANGQVYGGREENEENQMPVEESGNMLLLNAAVARTEGNADVARKYWPLLTKWAEYLKEKGLDPENQLSTDDFAGHLAHNANLSAKAILALRAYGMLAEMTGHASEAAAYDRTASEFARRWMEIGADRDHYRLAFDKAGTWSQKYNLVWDKIFRWHVFPPEVAREEVAFYLKHMNEYGLPLDNRRDYTKLDWLIWTATLADSQADFRAIADSGWTFANGTPTRVPLSDWYSTVSAKQQGFQARSVVGGLFIPMVTDAALWKKWSQPAR